jgi:NADPH-dependent 2,4-dienoyl-CoA reductase/sulfur reductase-like enzyme
MRIVLAERQQFQLQLVANLGKLYDAPPNPDDPEDILIILAYAFGGAAAEAAGKAGMQIGGKAAGVAAKAFFSKDMLKLLQKISAKIGVRILQRTIVKLRFRFYQLASGPPGISSPPKLLDELR